MLSLGIQKGWETVHAEHRASWSDLWRARIELEEVTWNRIQADGKEHDHAFVQMGGGVRTAVVNVDGRGEDRKAHVVSGIKDLVVLKSTGSEFHGFLKDKYTTLEPTNDRVMATSLIARWRYNTTEGIDWNKTYDAGVIAPRA